MPVVEIISKTCRDCYRCLRKCRVHAITVQKGHALVAAERCLYCGQCVRVCPTGTLGEGSKGYRVLVGGKLGRHPRLGTELSGIHDPEQISTIVGQCLNHYQKHCQKGERFGVILERTGLKDVKKGIH